jgi:DNA-directed RNA polymerase subunit H
MAENTKSGLNHILVPKHELISEKEKQQILEQYKITVDKLPMILFSDPAIKHLEAKAGDVIKITRKSLTAGTSYFYRGVISD